MSVKNCYQHGVPDANNFKNIYLINIKKIIEKKKISTYVKISEEETG